MAGTPGVDGKGGPGEQPEAARVALTVDAEHPDGSRSAALNCARLLDALGRARRHATFFLQGRWVTSQPDLAREVAAQGHLIGNHSHYHAPLPLLTEEGWQADVTRAQEAILSVVGRDPRPHFRSPFGAGLGLDELDRVLARLGYRNHGWDVDGRDWEEGRSSGQVEEALVRGALEGNGLRVLLLHSWSDQAADALPGILSRLLDRGATFVTVDGAPAGY
ncbi:MAG: polysaccharide deacetylase family protein [Candidatus Dormibacteria bacterium]